MIEVRCPKCNRLLFKTAAPGPQIEIFCRYCDALITWPSLRAEILIKEKAKPKS
jgi:hypothetical protein